MKYTTIIQGIRYTVDTSPFGQMVVERSVNGVYRVWNLISEKKLKKIAKGYVGVNRIHKPMALLFWTDCKNGKANNWNLIKSEVTQ